jgi:hypothetical protein
MQGFYLEEKYLPTLGRPRTKLTEYDMIYYIYLTAVGLTPGGSSTSHIYTHTVRITQR